MKAQASVVSFFSSLILLTTANAGASITCRDTAGGPDNGYIVTLKGNQAVVEEITIAGSRTVAGLVCQKSQAAPPPCCDIPQLVLVCSEPSLRDAGYSFSLSTGGFANFKSGALSQVSIAGSRQIAQLICQ